MMREDAYFVQQAREYFCASFRRLLDYSDLIKMSSKNKESIKKNFSNIIKTFMAEEEDWLNDIESV